MLNDTKSNPNSFKHHFGTFFCAFLAIGLFDFKYNYKM